MKSTDYKGFRADEMEYQYNPRESVPEYPELAKVRAAQAKKVRETAKSWLNVAYGASPREKLDIYPADRPNGTVLVYIHGGYWRGGSKDDNANFVPTFTRRGATVVMVEYDLCPTVTVTDIVRQTRGAIAWVYKHIRSYNANPEKLFVSGHSAGGHLTALALAHDWSKEGMAQDCIKGAVPTSGVFDLDMVMRISVQEQVRMTPECAKANSPFLNPPRVKCPMVVAVGGAEPKGWQQMSEDYFNYCKQQGMSVDYLVVPGANHYTMSEHLLDEKSPLTQAMIQQMEL